VGTVTPELRLGELDAMAGARRLTRIGGEGLSIEGRNADILDPWTSNVTRATLDELLAVSTECWRSSKVAVRITGSCG